MLFPTKNRDDLEKLEKLTSLQNRVEEVRLQDKLGKQNFHENTEELFEPLTDTKKISLKFNKHHDVNFWRE